MIITTHLYGESHYKVTTKIKALLPIHICTYELCIVAFLCQENLPWTIVILFMGSGCELRQQDWVSIVVHTLGRSW